MTDDGKDDLWYLRNRARDSILSMARTIREIQLIAGLKDSQIFVIFYNVWDKSPGGQQAALLLYRIYRSMGGYERTSNTSFDEGKE